MVHPPFYVIARVVGRDGALPLWRERLVALCAVSATEVQGISYYWGHDVDSEPDTLWGLEGYSHATGFFLGHPSSDIFKEEMAKVDEDELLRHVQGLGSPDYDLHHYDFFSGWLTRADDKEKDAKDSFVIIMHYWTSVDQRKALLKLLSEFAENVRASETGPKITVQSCGVLKECIDTSMVSLYLRTRTQKDWSLLESSNLYARLQADLKKIITKSEMHRSQAFNGHIDKEPILKF